MRKMIQKIAFFLKRKGYEEDPTANNIWEAVEPNTPVAADVAVPGTTSVKLPTDVVAQLKQAHKEVQDFEQTLKSIKQNITV